MLTILDFWIVGIFFLIVFVIGIFERKKLTIEDYWVNSRRTNKFILVATVSSTFIGAGAILGNAGIAFSGGGLATMVLMASFFSYFLVYSKFFAQKVKEFGDKYKAYTIPDFLGIRYSNNVRIAGIVVNIV